MSENTKFDMGATDAPENKEREFITPGYRKLTVKEFVYTPEEKGKTPLILMKAEGKAASGETVEFVERLYISGKKNKEGKWSSIIRLQELYKGLTGNPKMTIQPELYNYTKDENDGSSKAYTIPNPKELCDYLNKHCKGKTAIFKVGGEEGKEGTIFSKLTYSSFLYYTDKQGNLCKYKEEGDFSDKEYAFCVKKYEAAPEHAGGVAAPSQLDEL